MIFPRSKAFLAVFIVCFFLGYLVLYHSDVLLAQGIDIGGKDSSAQMKDVQNLITTVQKIGFQWVAKLIGGFLVIGGVYKIACREFVNGGLSTFGGGTLFFVEKIADALSNMGGT